LSADLRHAGEYDRVVVCDIAIDLGLATVVKKALDDLSKGKELVYIDHHPLPPGITAPWLVHDTSACGSLLTFDHFRQALDIDLSRVAMYGAIGDYRDNTPLADAPALRWTGASTLAGTLAGIEMVRRDYDYVCGASLEEPV
jgi:RecJ-like exonuclease